MKPWPCPISNLTIRPVDAEPRCSAGRAVPPGTAFRPADRDGRVTALPARFSPTSTAAEVAAATARCLGTGLVHSQVSAAHLSSVQRSDRLLRLLVCAHLDEREAARAAGHLIAHDRHRVDGASLPEQVLQLGF